MLADMVTSALTEIRGRKDSNGRGLTPTAVAIYGFRKLEEMCMVHARNPVECRAAILRFKRSVSVPVDPRRYLQLEAKIEAARRVPHIERLAESGLDG